MGKFIGFQTQLSELNMCHTNLQDSIGLRLFENISDNCCSIQKLDFASCTLSEEMSDKLGKFIGLQTNLINLDFSYINLEKGIGVRLFKNISQNCSNIKMINFQWCTFSHEMSGYLGNFIGNQVNLRELNLYKTDL